MQFKLGDGAAENLEKTYTQQTIGFITVPFFRVLFHTDHNEIIWRKKDLIVMI